MILATLLRKPIAWAIGAVLILALLWGGYRWLTADERTEARLSKNQAGAAVESGRDAVETVGAAAEREAAGEVLTRENEAAIRGAPGATDPVSAEARGAGLQALCKRQAYKDDPRCAQ